MLWMSLRRVRFLTHLSLRLQLRRSLLSQRESAVAMLRASAAESDGAAVRQLREELEADTDAELGAVRAQLQLEREDKLQEVRRSSAERRAQQVEELTRAVNSEKQRLTEAGMCVGFTRNDVCVLLPSHLPWHAVLHHTAKRWRQNTGTGWRRCARASQPTLPSPKPSFGRRRKWS